MRAAILAAIQPSQTEQTRSVLQNASKKRKRVQRKHGEVLTYSESLSRLKAEEEQRLSKNKEKENRQKRSRNLKCKAKKAMLMVEEDICHVCKEEEPPCESDEESDIDWVKCHRSDLVIDDPKATVSEFKHWHLNLKSVATFYRASAVRTNELESIAILENKKTVRFPEFHEIRFAEHLQNLAFAVAKNLPFARKHWVELSENGEREKSAANGFLKVWKCGSQQEMLTFVILDILRLLKELQKECQRNMVVMPDIILKKEQTIQSFDLMLDGPYPGGEEEKHLRELQSYDVDVAQRTERRNITNTNVSTQRRDYNAVRHELVLSTKSLWLNVLILNKKKT
eukprot:gene20956-23007_t